MNGVAFGGLGLAGCASAFRTCRCFIKGCFAILLGVYFVFKAKLVVAIYMTEYALFFLVGGGCGWRATQLT